MELDEGRLTMPTILCRVVWATSYRDRKEKVYAAKMSNPTLHLEANERLNFANEEGFAYGFVERRRSQINLEKLGAPKDADSVDGITVIWFASSPIDSKLRVVGWYENAKAYRVAQDPKAGSIRKKWQYSFRAKFEDAHLVPLEERSLLEVPAKVHRTDRGYIGQRFWFYPEESANYVSFLESFRLICLSGTPVKRSEEEEIAFREGQRNLIEMMVSARNPKLVAIAKQKHGFSCQACGFNFENVYGSLGKGFIEAHHKIALASKKGSRTSSIDDINVLCANCHRMVHKRTPPLDVNELRKLLARSRS